MKVQNDEEVFAHIGRDGMATSNPAGAIERHMMQPRVPADKLADARALTSPLSNSPSGH